MTEELLKLKEEFETLQQQYISKGREILEKGIKSIFDDYPSLNSFYVNVSNHEWNDGDATHFSVRYEEPVINGVYDEDYDEDDADLLEELELTPVQYEEIKKRISDVFSTVYVELETFYGDEYESITFTRGEEVC